MTTPDLIARLKERTLADYRPQHDANCLSQSPFVGLSMAEGQGPCTCGLSALLHSAAITSLSASPQLQEKKDHSAGLAAVDNDTTVVQTPELPHVKRITLKENCDIVLEYLYAGARTLQDARDSWHRVQVVINETLLAERVGSGNQSTVEPAVTTRRSESAKENQQPVPLPPQTGTVDLIRTLPEVKRFTDRYIGIYLNDREQADVCALITACLSQGQSEQQQESDSLRRGQGTLMRALEQTTKELTEAQQEIRRLTGKKNDDLGAQGATADVTAGNVEEGQLSHDGSAIDYLKTGCAYCDGYGAIFDTDGEERTCPHCDRA